MSRPKQGNTNQATSAKAFDFDKWKTTAKRKWAQYNFAVQFKNIEAAWKNDTNVQECAKDILDRLQKTYNINDKGPGSDLQRMEIGELKPTMAAASSRGIRPGVMHKIPQVTGVRDDLKTKLNTDARKGASGGMKELNPNHLDLQTQWFGDLLCWLTHSFEEDGERRIQQPEIPDALKIHSDSYTDIQALLAGIHKNICAISTPVVQSVTRLEKEISSLNKDMRVIDARLSKLLTSLDREEENKKEQMENITASQLNGKIDRCQQLATQLQESRRGMDADVTNVYKQLVTSDARELPSANDMIQHISDVLTKQQTSPRMIDQGPEINVEVEEHLEKSERKQFVKVISSMKKDTSVIDARLSKLLTSLGSEEESKKEKMEHIAASQLNGKIDRCQRLATGLQDRFRGINAHVTKVYNHFGIKDARELPSATDMIQHISDVLTKQEKSLRMFKETEGNRSTLREYCKTFNELNDHLTEHVSKPQRRVPAADDSLPVISSFILTAVKDIEKSIDTQMQKFSLAEGEYDGLRYHCEYLYNLSSKLNPQGDNPPWHPMHTLHQISNGLGGIIGHLGTCVRSTTKQIDKVQQENADIKWKMDSQQGMIHGLEDERKQLQQEMRNIYDEKNELLCRLSKFASAKLTLDNPNITDLSDTDRPIKLAERYSELYDNEWTDAFQALTDKLKYDDRKAIAALLNIITGVSQYCARIGQTQQIDIRLAISYPASKRRDKHEHMRLPDHHGKTVADLVKNTADISEKDLLSTYTCMVQPEHGDSCDPKVLAQKECLSYRDRCVNLCWKMALQNPPVYLEGSLKERSTFDTKLYKPYQTTGKKVAYLIWPALFLHQGGTLLMKGVAEGMKK